MLKKLWKIVLLGLFASPVHSQTAAPWQDAPNLVLRFTGDEANRLRGILKENMPEKLDFGTIRYVGNLNSLACSNRNQCYLWLSQKEWAAVAGPETQLTFALSLNGLAWKGQLRITDLTSHTSQVHLDLVDAADQAVFSLASASCSSDADASLKANDCHIERSDLIKKYLPYPPSRQYLANSDNIVLSFEGTPAQKLFATKPAETDPKDTSRRRVQLSPDFYCWHIPEPETYVCQGLYKQPDWSNDKIYLKLNFVGDVLNTLTVVDDQTQLGVCPVATKQGTDLSCKIFYNWKAGIDSYPISNPIQGVAVGWGRSETNTN